MTKAIASFIFKISGWKVDTNIPIEMNRCLVIAAPHTSNWDFWYTMLSFKILGLKIRYTIKKEWMRFPFNIITKPTGGIAIDRSPARHGEERISHIDAMINLFATNKELIIVITPEGTRSIRTTWKTGFYHIATGAGVPICLGYVDYKKKIAGIAKTIYPSNLETDMKTIMDFYKNISPKFPEKFSIDTNYL